MHPAACEFILSSINDVYPSEEDISCQFTVTAADGFESVEVLFEEQPNDPRIVIITMKIRLPCNPAGSGRLRVYLAGLCRKLRENKTTTIVRKDKLSFQFQVNDTALPEDSEITMTQVIGTLFHQHLVLLYEVSGIAADCYIVDKMPGTPQYKKLLPTQLLAFTMHGHEGPIWFN